MKKTLFYFILTFLPILGFGQILQEGFNDVPALEANGWTITNQSQPVGSTSWFQGNTTVFNSHEGPANSYAGANYNNTSGSGGIISAWLITPSVNVKDGDKLSFWTRTASGSVWNDRMEVRASQGAMTLPVGAAGVGSFTNLLLVINDDLDLSYPENWTKYEIVISGVGSTPVAMNFAFRNSLDNTSGNEGNFIGIDTLLIEEGGGGNPDPDDCDPVDVPYIQDFQTAIVPAMPDCTTFENAGTGNNWETSNEISYGFTANYLRYKWNSSNPANAWFYTQGINLTAGTEYSIKYDYGGTGTYFEEKLKVAYGTNNEASAMTTVLADHPNIVNNTPITNEVTFTPTTTGVYYFGFNAYSAANKFYLHVDNIIIDVVGGGNPDPDDCDPVNVPYTQDFESSAVPAMPDCTTIENAGTGNDWATSNTPDGEFTGTFLSYKYHANAANAWFYTQGINLTAGTVYEITYEYGSKAQAAFPENLKVAFGNDNTHTAMTTVLADHIGILTGATKLTNTVEFTPTTSGVFYFGFNAHSNADQWYLYVDNIHIDLAGDPEPIDGCLDAPNGQYPSATFTPSCVGTPEAITDLGWTGEFSKVNLTAGTEYIFSSSIATDFITISNEAGTEVYAAGVTPLTYTATNNEVVRFYLHLDDECNYTTSGLRSRMVQCGEPVIIEEPDFDCFQGDGITSSFDNAYNIDSSNDFRTADDFTVEPGIQFTLRQITIDVNQQEVPNNAVINIREDNAGSPGAIVDVITMAPTSSIAYGEAFGDPIYHLTFDLTTPLVYTEGTYWIEPKMSTPSAETVWWLATSTGSNGAIPQRSTDNGVTWAPDANGLQMVFFVAGDCETLGVSDLNSFDFAYYPNPVKDVLNITSQKAVKSIEAFNLTGQKVIADAKVLNGQINVSALTAGTYVFRVTLEGGQVETFKVIKK